ncbi:YhdP family protein [Hahella aquimaris]|uniref:YhdP family protein n=1 Tax=Hahella sp. HNIBRBA332 TaxID=3015983 RepID=UPI00273ACFA3|nr:YhdP family protein [Hahella sp. HNIBRBA332]WLQ14578.1 YhdP family protein [Hahella sp. HNIBRBA332]
MTIKSVLIKITQWIWYVAIALLVLVATYLSLGRNFFDAVSVFKEDLELRLSASLGATVRMEALEGSWDGFDPVITLKNVTLTDPNKVDSAMTLDSLVVQPDMVKSLFSMKLALSRVEIGDVSVNLEQSLSGGWRLPGLEQKANGGGALDWRRLADYMASPVLEFREIRLHWRYRDSQVAGWLIPVLTIQVDESDVAASGRILRAGDYADLGLFSVYAHDLLSSGKLNGEAYLSWRRGEALDPLLSLISEHGLQATDIEASGALWLTLEDNRLIDMTGDLDIPRLAWADEQTTLAPLQNIRARFNAALTEQGGWKVTAYDLGLDWAGDSWRGARALVDVGAEGTVRMAMDNLNLGLLSRLSVAAGILPDDASRRLASYQPEGALRNIGFNLDANRQFEVLAQLDQVRVAPHGGAPGGAGIDGFLQVRNHGGKVIFKGSAMQLSFPELYHAGWTFSAGEGRVEWRGNDDYVYVFGNGLRLKEINGLQAELSGAFSILLPHDKTRELNLELAIGVENADARVASLLVPGHIIPQELNRWLNQAVRGGQVTTGGYFYSGVVGPLATAANHRSQMFFNLKDGRLHYAEGWPELEHFDARLAIIGGELSAIVGEGSIAGTQVRSVKVKRDGGGGADSLLHISANIRPQQSDWDYWLKKSPIANVTAPVVEDWSVSGASSGVLDLTLDTVGVGAPRIDLKLKAAGLNLQSERNDLALTDLRGSLSFSTVDGIRATGMQGAIFGQPANLDVTTSNWSEQRKTLALKLASKIETPTLLDWLKIERKVPLSGQLPYRLALDLDHTDKSRIRLRLDSELLGAGIRAPAPFEKAIQDSLPLSVVRDWETQGGRENWSVSVKDLLKARFEVSDGKVNRGALAFVTGDSAPEGMELPARGVNVSGQLSRLSVSEWRAYLPEFLGADMGDTPASAPDWLNRVSMQVGKLEVAGEWFSQVDVRLQRGSGGLDISLDDGERLTGTLSIHDDARKPPFAKFRRLYISDSAATVVEKRMTPADVPLAQVDIEDLRLGGKQLGSWAWVTQPREDGVVFSNMFGRLADATVTARLSWLMDPQTGHQTSILTGDMKGVNFDRFYENLAEEAPLTAEDYSFNTGIVWQGGPTEFQWKDVTGQISFKMSSGVFREASNSANIFRVFGILNTDSITRRLRLDFSDLYRKGLAYDQIEGEARIEEGVMNFESPLAIQTLSSGFKITGKTSLVDDTLDMQMVVVLPVTKNLPLAAVLVGAPQVGGALFLIDKLLGDPLSRMTSATYKIKGTLDNPEVSLQQIFDNTSGGSASQRRRAD